MDQNETKLSKALAEYSLGNFDYQTELDNNEGHINVFLSALNMLGEELKETTITKNYFNAIFNSVTDIIMVLSLSGWIADCNQATIEILGYEKEDILGRLFHQFQPPKFQLPFEKYQPKLRSGQIIREDSVLTATGNKELPVAINIIPIAPRGDFPGEILITARDKRSQIYAERNIQRAIIDTQETEKRRLARDLHDGLGQQITAIHFFINSALNECDNPRQAEILNTASRELVKLMDGMHDTCFMLMPRTLEEHGLKHAIRELCAQDLYFDKVKFEIRWNPNFPLISKALEVDLYRVIQEFLKNALQHGRAKRIKMHFLLWKEQARVVLVDDGTGFRSSKSTRSGMGLRNIYTRINSHGGQVEIESAPGKGTIFDLIIPI